jgi:hypothetical protein
MKLYRFSPIETKEQLIEAITHIHFACFELCQDAFGKALPVAGNIGVFCHYDDEYKFLTQLRKELTEESENFNQKYFKLHEPIVVPAKGDAPETTYEYLYIRHPDPYRAQAGDVDFVLEVREYSELKQSLLDGKKIKGARVYSSPTLDMIELYNPDIDALGYVTTNTMAEKVRTTKSKS